MSNTNKSSSDSNFYLIMLALIIVMGFYISYDIDKRYGSSVAVETQPEVTPAPAAVVVDVVVAPIAVPVVEEKPAPVIVEVKDETVEVAEAKPAVEEKPVVEEKPAEAAAPLVEAPAPAAVQPIHEAVAVEAEKVINTVTRYIPIPVPVPVPVPVKQETAPAYQNYGQPNQRGNYYQQAPQNSYNSPYGNYYQQSPYGYNPYQQQNYAPSN